MKMVNIDEEIFISSEQLEISMKFGCMGCMFYAHTGLCNQFEAVLGSWVHTFPTEFASFCLCYNLGQ